MAIYQKINFMLLMGVMAGLMAGAKQDDQCMPTRCSKHGPEIRFPFWLKDRQSSNCGYHHPGFDLSCTDQTEYPLLQLTLSVNVSVKKIDYKTQTVRISDPHGCFPRQFPKLNLSASPFQLAPDHSYDDLSFFNCSSSTDGNFIRCLSDDSHKVYAFRSSYSIFYRYPSSCRKMYNMSLPLRISEKTSEIRLAWSKPMCGNCEAEGKYCRLKKNSTKHETECFDKPKQPSAGASRKLEIAGVVLGLSLLVVAVIALFLVHRSNTVMKLKIAKLLEDYKALKPARYSYADIKKITDQFQNKIGEGGYGSVYKGKLSNDVHVAVKILNTVKGNGEEFINEVGTMGRIHHINVVRLVGYCADGFRRALLYEFLPNKSLEKFISSDHERRSLGWEKLQNIALGIAKGIEYLHQGCEQRILHFDIKPHNILLDHKFNPKISDFGLAKLCSKENSAVSMTAARGTVGYIAPEVFSRNFGNVSHKSDVYSYGMLLLEMAGGRKNPVTQNTSETYFPEWIYKRLEQGEELGIQIEEDGDAKIVRKLTIVGLWCIQWYPVDRPSMKVVVQMLEGDGSTLTVPPSPFTSTNPVRIGGTMGGRTFNSELEVISESE